ncbi:hypothetical protein D3C75_1077350 [compost metagenome]
MFHEHRLVVDLVVIEHIIRAQPGYIIACRIPDAVVQCGGGAAVAFTQILDSRQIWRYPFCMHGRTVINHDDFMRLQGLGHGALQRLFNIRAIVKRNNN